MSLVLIGCEKQEEAQAMTVVTTDKEMVTIVAEDSAETMASEQQLDIDQMVSEAILKENSDYFPGYECRGEGHRILSSERNGSVLTVYALTMYGEYAFHDQNHFVKDAGTGAIPEVIEFMVNDAGAYKWKSYQEPSDGSGYVESLQELFPEEFWEICISPTEDVRRELQIQEQDYAAGYLETLGRQAQIGEYADFEHTILTEAGVSAEASNRILEYREKLGNFPMWIGSQERLEDGVRYVYEQKLDEAAGKILFVKWRYDTGETVEMYQVDMETGEMVK